VGCAAIKIQSSVIVYAGCGKRRISSILTRSTKYDFESHIKKIPEHGGEAFPRTHGLNL
jgi:hypothetical protein